MKTKLFDKTTHTSYTVFDNGHPVKTAAKTYYKSFERNCVEFAKFYFGARKDDCLYVKEADGTHTFYVKESDNTLRTVGKFLVSKGDYEGETGLNVHIEVWYHKAKYFPKGKDGTRTEKEFFGTLEVYHDR